MAEILRLENVTAGYGATVVIEDVLLDEAYEPFQEVARHANYRAVISVPLFAADGSRLGAISVHFHQPQRPSEAEMRRLQLYCRQASDFIQRIRLEQTLRQSQEALQEADRRKNEFIALLAHELRNPLAPIRYALATIARPELTGEQKLRSEAIIERQVSHMSRLLDDLLDISRITRGTLELKRSRVDFAEVIATAVEAAQPFLDAKRHELVVTQPEHPVTIDADAVRLAQVFSNLLINAAKYTGEKFKEAGKSAEPPAKSAWGEQVARTSPSALQTRTRARSRSRRTSCSPSADRSTVSAASAAAASAGVDAVVKM